MLTDGQIRGLLNVMVRTTPNKRNNLAHLYLGRSGDRLLPYLTEYFEREGRAEVRGDLLRFAGPASPTDYRARELAARALSDKSKKVRGQALWLLARSCDPSAIAVLASWHPRTDWEAEHRDRAILVIERQDLREWIRGTIYAGVHAWAFSREVAGSDEFKASVDRYVKRFAADLVPDLEKALGNLYLEAN